MKTKYVLSGFVFLLLFLSPILSSASAQEFKVSKHNPNIYAYVIKPGWNLVPAFFGDFIEGYEDVKNTPLITTDETLISFRDTIFDSDSPGDTLKGVKYMFIYDLQEKKYVKVFSNYKLNSEIHSVDYNDYLRYPVVWIYSDYNDKLYLPLKIDYDYEINPKDYSLRRGWNLITYTRNMFRNAINDWKGSCNVEKLAIFEVDYQKWNVIDLTDKLLEQPIADDNDDNKLVPLAIAMKVSSSCTLGDITEAEIEPPSLP